MVVADSDERSCLWRRETSHESSIYIPLLRQDTSPAASLYAPGNQNQLRRWFGSRPRLYYRAELRIIWKSQPSIPKYDSCCLSILRVSRTRRDLHDPIRRESLNNRERFELLRGGNTSTFSARCNNGCGAFAPSDLFDRNNCLNASRYPGLSVHLLPVASSLSGFRGSQVDMK